MSLCLSWRSKQTLPICGRVVVVVVELLLCHDSTVIIEFVVETRGGWVVGRCSLFPPHV